MPKNVQTTTQFCSFHIFVVQLPSCIRFFATPWTATCQASLSFTISWSCSNSCALSSWCHSTISSSVASSPPAFSLSQLQGLFQWVGSLQWVAKVLELQLQHQSFQCIFRIELWYDPRVPLLDIHPCSYENIYLGVHSISVYNEQNMETTQMSISWWMDTQMYIHPKEYHSAKKKWTTDICYHLHESWKHYAKWKKPDTKGSILHYYI